MHTVGQEEIRDALTKVIKPAALFRYGVGHECDSFEERYASYLGIKHFALAASGSNALVAAMIGLGLGPGDEVLIPAHTYMATATSVLAVGAIPVIVDIDESLTIDPKAIEAGIRPRTKAVVPVHMWGAACNMGAIMDIARRHNLLVIEDACQGVGGSYEGKKFGTIGHAGCFSFNYFKNMTCGEGGGIAVNDDTVAERARCAIDPCHFYWHGRNEEEKPFAGNGARPSELMGAMLNVQLDRIDGMIGAMRTEKQKILAGTASLDNLGLRATPMNSAGRRLRDACDVHSAQRRRGRPVRENLPERHRRQDRQPPQLHRMGTRCCSRRGAAHPLMNPYLMPANAECRRAYSKDMCQRSLDILNRTVMVPTSPHHSEADIEDIIHNIGTAARIVFAGLAREDADLRNLKPIDAQKFDMPADA